MESQSHAFIAGLFVVFLGLVAIAGAAWLGPHEAPGMRIDLLTTHSVAGLKVGAPVRFRGVDVGHVDSIAFDARRLGQIRVGISVDRAAPLTSATYARLSYQGINGVALVQLDEDTQKSGERLRLSAGTVREIELQAGLLERVEDDVHGLLMKTTRVADRLDRLLNDDNQKRLMALVDSAAQTAQRYGALAQRLEPSAQALPGLLQQATLAVERAQGAVDGIAKLAQDTDRKLDVLDSVATAATRFGQVAEDLHEDTLPRLKGLSDDLSVDARELQWTLHQANVRPQSFIFGLQPLPAGPGEPGFNTTAGLAATQRRSQ